MEVQPCPVVALVASGGGLPAASQMLRDLPADLPACVMVHHLADSVVRRLVTAGQSPGR